MNKFVSPQMPNKRVKAWSFLLFEWIITFLKNYVLQRQPFLINSSPLLITKYVFMLTSILINYQESPVPLSFVKWKQARGIMTTSSFGLVYQLKLETETRLTHHEEVNCQDWSALVNRGHSSYITVYKLVKTKQWLDTGHLKHYCQRPLFSLGISQHAYNKKTVKNWS